MSSGLSHFSSEDIEHLSNDFCNMGREFKSSQYSDHYGFTHNSGHVWDDDLKEDDVWGSHDANTDWNHSHMESDTASSAYSSGGAVTSGTRRKSGLSMELQTAGLVGHKKGHVGIGFAAVEAVSGGWVPGFSSRKVKIPQVGGGANGGTYVNGRYDCDVRGGMPQSAPVSMPVWPANCGYENSNGYVEANNSYAEDGTTEEWNDDEDSDEDVQAGRTRRLAPHEIVDREYARSTTFSVIEGAGRTLKGKDQCRVRNAVWSRTGFED